MIILHETSDYVLNSISGPVRPSTVVPATARTGCGRGGDRRQQN